MTVYRRDSLIKIHHHMGKFIALYPAGIQGDRGVDGFLEIKFVLECRLGVPRVQNQALPHGIGGLSDIHNITAPSRLVNLCIVRGAVIILFVHVVPCDPEISPRTVQGGISRERSFAAIVAIAAQLFVGTPTGEFLSVTLKDGHLSVWLALDSFSDVIGGLILCLFIPRYGTNIIGVRPAGIEMRRAGDRLGKIKPLCEILVPIPGNELQTLVITVGHIGSRHRDPVRLGTALLDMVCCIAGQLEHIMEVYRHRGGGCADHPDGDQAERQRDTQQQADDPFHVFLLFYDRSAFADGRMIRLCRGEDRYQNCYNFSIPFRRVKVNIIW